MISAIGNTFSKLESRFKLMPYMYALLANCCIGLTQCAGKFLGASMSTPMMICLRGIILLIINTPVIKVTDSPVYVKNTKNFVMISMRVVLATANLVLFFYSLQFVSLSILNAVWMTSPIWTHFIEAIFLNVPFQKSNLIVALCCLLGIFLIVKPDFFFGSGSNDMLLFCCILTLLGSLCTAVSLVIIRQLRKSITNLQNLQNFYYYQIIINAVLIIYQGGDASQVKDLSLFTMAWVGVMVVSAYGAQIMMTRALYLKSASEVGLFTYTLIIVALLLDIFVFGQHLDLLSFVGVVIICVSLLAVMLK